MASDFFAHTIGQQQPDIPRHVVGDYPVEYAAVDYHVFRALVDELKGSTMAPMRFFGEKFERSLRPHIATYDPNDVIILTEDGQEALDKLNRESTGHF